MDRPAVLGRRRFLRMSAAGASAACFSSLWACEMEGFPLKAGVGKAEITAPLEVGILMSSGRGLWQPFEGVRLPLYARAAIVQCGEKRMAIVALDLIGLAGEAVGGMDGFRRRVVDASGGAVAADDLVLASSHTHSAPESIALTDLRHTQPFHQWIDRLARQIGSALQSAASDLRPCRFAVAEQPAPGIGINRRIRTTKGIMSAWADIAPDTVVGPEGPTDDVVRVAALLDRGERPLAIFVNATAHPVLEMCLPEVSPDFPGEMAIDLERRYPGSMALFLQGACGNINPPKMERSPANAAAHGRSLAGFVDEALGKLKPVSAGPFGLRWRSVELPARALAGEPAPQPLKTRIGAARIGNAALVFLPGEPFLEIALAIRKTSPANFTAVVGYADDYIGYIPTDLAFKNGGYETSPGRWSRLAPGSEKVVVEAASALLRT